MATSSPPDVPAHTLSIEQLCERFDTSIDRLDVNRSLGLAATSAQTRLNANGKNVLSVYTPEAPADWGVDPSAGDDSLDSALVSNEIGDVDAGTLAALPRAALEQLTIHLMANIRVRGHDCTDFMESQWKDRWNRWTARQRVLHMRPDESPHGSRPIKVRRDGEWAEIPSEDVVVGDVVALRTADVCPADVVFLHIDQSENLELCLEELSGVSRTLPRTTYTELDKDCTARNVGVMGSSVLCGSGMALVTATGMDTILGNVLRLADQTRKLPPPEGSGYDPTAVNVPLHFDSLEVQLNNRSVTHLLAFLTTIVADREAVLIENFVEVTHVVLGTDILQYTKGDLAHSVTPEGLQETPGNLQNTLVHSSLSAEPPLPVHPGSLADSLQQQEQAAEQERRVEHKPPPRLYAGPFRLRVQDLPVGAMLRSDALHRLAVAGILCAQEPPSAEPVNQAVRRWAAEFPFGERMREQYRIQSSCFFQQLNLYGSLHVHASDPTDKTGYLLIHGAAHRVFTTSNNVLTSKGVVAMSTLQKTQFHDV